MTLLSKSTLGTIHGVLQPGCCNQRQIDQIRQHVSPILSDETTTQIRNQLSPLIGVQLDVLRLPKLSLKGFEPSQIGTTVGTIMDACIPQLDKVLPNNKLVHSIGLEKHEGILGEREGYPDYKLPSGVRLELKLLYVDPVGVAMKTPPTPREPSARLTQKVTYKNVDPEKDILLVLAYRLEPSRADIEFFSPTIIDIGLFPVIDCVIARDVRMTQAGGVWFGNFETPAIPSKIGINKLKSGRMVDMTTYGRKESEGKDFNEDTNFGKLKRIPYRPLQQFLKLHGAVYASSGIYPSPWRID
jgi:hypothetical protein